MYNRSKSNVPNNETVLIFEYINYRNCIWQKIRVLSYDMAEEGEREKKLKQFWHFIFTITLI